MAGHPSKGYRIVGEAVSDAVGEEFGRLIAERDRRRYQAEPTPEQVNAVIEILARMGMAAGWTPVHLRATASMCVRAAGSAPAGGDLREARET
jgi:hypothetical protein